MRKATKKKKKGSRPARKANQGIREVEKPHFACERYPKCPRHIESTSYVSELADEEEGTPATVNIDSRMVSGSCRSRCHVRFMETSINHSVMMIINGRVVDIGS